MAARSSNNNNPAIASDYHRLRDDSNMQLHHGSASRQEQHGYMGHPQQPGPYPLHLVGAPQDLRQQQRESPPGGAFLLPSGGGGGGGGSGARGGAVGTNAGMMSAPSAAAPPAAREGYADVAVARQCEREGCNVQPSYGKVWKKVRGRTRTKTTYSELGLFFLLGVVFVSQKDDLVCDVLIDVLFRVLLRLLRLSELGSSVQSITWMRQHLPLSLHLQHDVHIVFVPFHPFSTPTLHILRARSCLPPTFLPHIRESLYSLKTISEIIDSGVSIQTHHSEW